MLKRRYDLIVPLAAILLSTSIAISLFLEKRYYPMTGWVIITVIVILALYFALRTGKNVPSDKNYLKEEPTISSSVAVETHDDENYVRLISSTNPIEVEAIKNALTANNIHCVVFDQHSFELTRFIPDVEMRIMVSPKDYEDGLKII